MSCIDMDITLHSDFNESWETHLHCLMLFCIECVCLYSIVLQDVCLVRASKVPTFSRSYKREFPLETNKSLGYVCELTHMPQESHT